MKTTFLLNHIDVGSIEKDDLSSALTPKLKIFIEGDGFELVLKSYNFNFVNGSIEGVYLLTEYDGEGNMVKTLFKFDTEDIKDENWPEFYLLNEIDE